jgi:hypothetical protein
LGLSAGEVKKFDTSSVYADTDVCFFLGSLCGQVMSHAGL